MVVFLCRCSVDTPVLTNQTNELVLYMCNFASYLCESHLDFVIMPRHARRRGGADGGRGALRQARGGAVPLPGAREHPGRGQEAARAARSGSHQTDIPFAIPYRGTSVRSDCPHMS